MQNHHIKLKKTLLSLLAKSVENELDTALKSANQARLGSTHSDAEAKSKYDTQATELSYLANGQSMRAKSLHQQLALIRAYEARYFEPDHPITTGSIVHIQMASRIIKRYFILPFNGGISLFADGSDYHILSNTSPLGAKLLELDVGDEIDSTKNVIATAF